MVKENPFKNTNINVQSVTLEASLDIDAKRLDR